MSRVILSSAAALTLALAGVTMTPFSGVAQSLELRLGDDGPRVQLRDRCDPRYEGCYRDDGYYAASRGDRREMRRVCTEGRALDKAERMGLDRVRVVSAGRHTIQVRGRTDEGERARITFGRDWNCPILG